MEKIASPGQKMFSSYTEETIQTFSCLTIPETPHLNTAEYRKKTVRIQLSSIFMNACERQLQDFSFMYPPAPAWAFVLSTTLELKLGSLVQLRNMLPELVTLSVFQLEPI